MTVGQLPDAFVYSDMDALAHAPDYIYSLARKRRIPTLALGRYYRFRLASIEAWEEVHEADDGRTPSR